MLPRDCDSIGCSDMVLSGISWNLSGGGPAHTQAGIFEPDVGSEKEQGGSNSESTQIMATLVRSLPGQVTRGYGYGDHKQIVSPRAPISPSCQLYHHNCCLASRPGFYCIHTLLFTLQPYQSGGTWSLESDGGTRKEGGEILFHRRTLCGPDLTPCSCWAMRRKQFPLDAPSRGP